MIARITGGAAVGMIAGLVAAFVMDRFQALSQPSADQGEPATQQAADKVATALTGEPLAKADKPIGGQLVHYGLGAALGAAYGAAAQIAPIVTAGLGIGFAGATWAVLDEALVPAVGLGDPPWQAPAKTQAYGFASHVVFGLTAELTRRLMHRALIKNESVRFRYVIDMASLKRELEEP